MKRGLALVCSVATLLSAIVFTGCGPKVNKKNVKFGSYKNEEIEWYVLDYKEGKNLLISKYILDTQMIYDPGEEEYPNIMTWEETTIRTWLNEDFMNGAFSNEEKAKIETTLVENHENDWYGTPGGNDTEDKIFLLSSDEAAQYFSSDLERVAKPTKQVKEKYEAWLDGKLDYSWFLRTPGIFGKKNATVTCNGRVDQAGEWGDSLVSVSDSSTTIHGIRPAMWVKLDKPVEMDHIDISHSDYIGEWSDPLEDPTEYVEFGYYGSEKIEWIVVDRKDGKTLLVSRYVLDAQLFHDKDEDVTWETCSLRTWLNDDFYNTAFNSAEQAKIQLSHLTTPDNPESGVPGGNDTDDKVFLLSYEELQQYDFLGIHQVAYATNYAYKQGITPNGYNYCQWWLRSPGASAHEAATVNMYGEQRDWANSFLNRNGIRPAIWVDLESPSEGANTPVDFDTSEYLMDYPVECSMTVYVKKAPYMEYPQKGISFMDQEHADYISDPCIHYITADKTFMNLDFYKEMNSPDHGYDVGQGSLYYSILSEESCQNGCTIYEIEEHSTWSSATSMIYLICWPVDANVTLLAEMDNFDRNHEHDTELQEILEFYRTTEDPFIAVAQ